MGAVWYCGATGVGAAYMGAAIGAPYVGAEYGVGVYELGYALEYELG